MNISSPLVADPQATIAVQPGERPFDDPAMFTKSFTAFNSLPGDPGSDPTLSQNLAVTPTVVSLVSVQFLRTSPWPTSPTPDRRDRIHHHFQGRRFIDIRGGVPYDERDALSFDHKMALRALFSSIRRVGAGGFAPPGAGTLPASKDARVQSSCSASPRRSSSKRCSRSHTPACCQSLKRRQQVIPLPQPISSGSISHGMPVLSTNRIPLKAARSETRGRPPLDFSPVGGSNGSIACQSSSLTSCFAMPQSYPFLGFC
jgi:hypothetical protein